MNPHVIWEIDLFTALVIQILQCCHVVHHTVNARVVSAWCFSVCDADRFLASLTQYLPKILQFKTEQRLAVCRTWTDQTAGLWTAIPRHPSPSSAFHELSKTQKEKHRKLSAVQPVHWLLCSAVFVTLPSRGSGAFLAVSVGSQRWDGPTRRAPLRPQWPWSARGWSDLHRFLVRLSAQQSTTLPRIYSETAKRRKKKMAHHQLVWKYWKKCQKMSSSKSDQLNLCNNPEDVFHTLAGIQTATTDLSVIQRVQYVMLKFMLCTVNITQKLWNIFLRPIFFFKWHY